MNLWVRKVPKSDKFSDDRTANGSDEKDTNGKVNGKKGVDEEYRRINMGGKNTASMQAGERIIIMTPGGGGWGKAGEESKAVKMEDPKHAWRQGSIAQRQAEAEASA